MRTQVCFFLVWLPGVLFAADYEILEKSDTILVQTSAFATEHHEETVRILTEEGTSYQKILMVNSYIRIKGVKGSVVYPDGHLVELRQEEIVELPLTSSPDILSDLKALVISPSGLERGCRVRIEYDRSITSLLYIDSWVYATLVPVRKASCTVTYPSHVPLKYRGNDPGVKVQKSALEGRTTLVFESANQREISMIGGSESFGNVEKQVEFLPEQCMTDKWVLSTASWQDVANWFSELSKFAYQSDPAMDGVIREVTGKHEKPEEIAEALYTYIQKNFVYTAIEIGIGGYKPRFATQTFMKKYGDCKDLAFLYLALLRKAGIEGYPALVDTRSHKFFFQDFPSPTQFNHCIAYLPKIRNGTWVDCTVKNFRLGEVPSVIQGKQALVVGGPNALLKIPEDFYNSNVMQLALSGVYSDKELKMSGQVRTSGQASMVVDSMQNALTKNNAKYYVYSTLLMQDLPIERLETSFESERSLKLGFSTPVQVAQQYRVLVVNALNYPPLDVLSLEVEADEQFALGSPVRLVVESNIDLSGLRLVTPPVSKEAKGKYVSYKLEMKEEQGKLRYLADAFFANGFLNDAEMKAYQQELREFAGFLQRVVVVE